MGGDGGSIPGRADIVRTKGFKFIRNLGGMGYNPNTQVRSEDKVAPLKARGYKLTHCNVSEETLRAPIAVCRMGNIFIKEKLIEMMIRKALPPAFSHIRSLKSDIREVHPDCFNESTRKLQCAISHDEIDGGLKATVNWKCGCIVSAKAAKELRKQKESSVCVSCGTACASEDVVPLVPTEEELSTARLALEQMMFAADAAKAKRKAAKEASAPADATTEGTAAADAGEPPKKKAKAVRSEKEVADGKKPSSSVYKSLFTSSTASGLKSAWAV
eukprot:GDKH01003027.1.p1 GENE.GDKH01003027.1~~GDKH01003027.1.p1  ORF type:complete len:273 (-),score=34.31 GDKH01003027.1:75-893(-)